MREKVVKAFKDYLRLNGVYSRFLRYTDEHIQDIQIHQQPEQWLYSVDWLETEEGYEFWHKLNKVWAEEIRILNGYAPREFIFDHEGIKRLF